MVARHERWFSGALVAPQAGGARRGGGAARAQACGRSAGRHCGPAGGPKRGRPDAEKAVAEFEDLFIEALQFANVKETA